MCAAFTRVFKRSLRIHYAAFTSDGKRCKAVPAVNQMVWELFDIVQVMASWHPWRAIQPHATEWVVSEDGLRLRLPWMHECSCEKYEAKKKGHNPFSAFENLPLPRT